MSLSVCFAYGGQIQEANRRAIRLECILPEADSKKLTTRKLPFRVVS